MDDKKGALPSKTPFLLGRRIICLITVLLFVVISGGGTYMTAAADKSAPPKDGHAASSPDGGPAAAPLGNAPADGPVIVDSRMTFAAAIAGTKAPPEVIAQLCLVDVRYYSFDGRRHQGQLVVHRAVRQDVVEIFQLIDITRFPIGKAVPIVAYRWSDAASMRDNNTSAFNYRTVAGTKRLSRHALGLAVDINPFRNPVVYDHGRISPRGAVYRPGEPGVLTREHPVVREFLRRGWQWGADFKTMKDYHHFDHPLPGQ